MTAAVVRIAGVAKAFHRDDGETVSVLEQVDLDLRPGDKASLVGPSGSGKSTLLALIAGLLRPDEGSIEIDGTPIESLDDRSRAHVRARRIGIALQSDNLIPFLTARENIEVALEFGGRSRRERRAAASALLERFGVAERAEHRPRHLSGGEAQRVALAVAMANRPALLLADEVVAQLDAGTAGQVVNEVLDADFAVLYVTHDIELADRADRRFALRHGTIEAR